MNVILNWNECWIIAICGVINYVTQTTKSFSRICTCFNLKTFNSIIMISYPIRSIIIIRNIMRYIISYKCPFFDWTSNCIFLYIQIRISIIKLLKYRPTTWISIICPWMTWNIFKWHVLEALGETRGNICWFLYRNKEPGWISFQIISPAIIPTAIFKSDCKFSYFWSIIWANTLNCCIVCLVFRKHLWNNNNFVCYLKVNCIEKAICSNFIWYQISRLVESNYSWATFI